MCDFVMARCRWFKEDLGFDSGYVFLRQSHDDFGYPSFVMSRSFLNQVLAHYDLLRNWKVSKVYL